MHTYSDTARPGGIRNSFRRGEAWLDQRGKWAWITLLVLLFVIAWPIALVLLAYMIWEKQMFSRSCSARGRRFDRANDTTWERPRRHSAEPTGNHAFDSYKAEALRRLEDEQAAFEAFLQRLRNSKDKSEFDNFMEDRARTAAGQAEGGVVADPDVASDTGPKPVDGARSGEY
ncbi:DUF2852 domain-containing protein [Tabrizicola sp.]|uniref:DUF2852 domain-containing protein n=1 Tax=Tabrizicola sp. TaxID=2005166 RepID=UPI0026137436|nr:DUF2852 domain-containing protein [Tabrizicola sp.]MDM7930834.1 DUF2852 domain-containing protein [Tabrizicola sp.]